MNRLEDGTLVNLPQIKPVTTPGNMKCEDSLMGTTKLTVPEQELLTKIISNYYTNSEL